MFGRDSHTPKPENLSEPRPLRMTSIAKVYFPGFIRELGTEKLYYQTFSFWTNPESIINTKDLAALYQHWEGEGFCYDKPEEDIGEVWYV